MKKNTVCWVTVMWVIFWLFIAGCEDEMTLDTNGEIQAEFQLLHSETLENGHLIEFYELDAEPGLLLISEEGNAGVSPVLQDFDLSELTAEEVYSRVLPLRTVPLPLREATTRQIRFRINEATTSEQSAITVDEEVVAPEEPIPLRVADGTTADHNATQRGKCGAQWFEDNVCRFLPRGQPYFWANRVTYTQKYYNNIKLLFKAAVCGDKGQVTWQVRVRKAWSWKTRFYKDVMAGKYRTYWYHCGANNHDFQSRVKNVDERYDRYHTCGGVNG